MLVVPPVQAQFCSARETWVFERIPTDLEREIRVRQMSKLKLSVLPQSNEMVIDQNLRGSHPNAMVPVDTETPLALPVTVETRQNKIMKRVYYGNGSGIKNKSSLTKFAIKTKIIKLVNEHTSVTMSFSCRCLNRTCKRDW